MKRRYRRGLEIGGGLALIALPPPGDEIAGLALLGAAGIGVHKMDQRPAATDNPRRNGNATAQDTPKYVAIIVIGAIALLAFEAGIFRKIVQ